MAVKRAPVNSTERDDWAWTEEQQQDRFYRSENKGGDAENSFLGLYDSGRFLVHGHVGLGCMPLLKIQFLPGPSYRKSLFEFAEPEVVTADVTAAASLKMSSKALLPAGKVAAVLIRLLNIYNSASVYSGPSNYKVQLQH